MGNELKVSYTRKDLSYNTSTKEIGYIQDLAGPWEREAAGREQNCVSYQTNNQMVAIYGEMVEAYLCLSGVETWGSIDWGIW